MFKDLIDEIKASMGIYGSRDDGSYGLLAEFRDPAALYHAAQGMQRAGYRLYDTYSPFPIHGIDRHMGIKPTILPYLVHVHLKDYRMTPSPEGYRVFHCAIGAGVVDYPALFDLFRTKDDLVCNIEMAALGERHIRLLTDAYWAGHTQRPVTDLLPVLRLRDQAEVDVEWRTPWEMENDSIMASWEMERLAESVTGRRGRVQPIVSQECTRHLGIQKRHHAYRVGSCRRGQCVPF